MQAGSLTAALTILIIAFFLIIYGFQITNPSEPITGMGSYNHSFLLSHRGTPNNLHSAILKFLSLIT